jgi:hypothetical protein
MRNVGQHITDEAIDKRAQRVLPYTHTSDPHGGGRGIRPDLVR